MALAENGFPDRSFENGVKRGLTQQERAEYDAPYPDPSSRRPVLQWPREIPIDGQPADVVAMVERYDAWLAASHDVPKLLVTFDAPTPLGSPSIIAWARDTIAALEVREIGVAIAGFRQRCR